MARKDKERKPKGSRYQQVQTPGSQQLADALCSPRVRTLPGPASRAVITGRMVLEMARTPDRLREPEQQREVAGEDPVQRSDSKKRAVNEIVRDRVGVPPEPERNERDRRREQEETPLGMIRDGIMVVPKFTIIRDGTVI